MYLNSILLDNGREFEAIVEERDAASGGKLQCQGTGEILGVTLLDSETDNSINAEMLEVCNSRQSFHLNGIYILKLVN